MHGAPIRRKASFVLSAGFAAALLLYPMLIYYGLLHFEVGWIAAALIAICLVRVLLIGQGSLRIGSSGAPFNRGAALLLTAGGIVLAVTSALNSAPDAMLYYPVLVNGTMLTLFAYSLIHPPTVIERIARLKDGDLPEKAVAYTRRVTVAWTIFFACNGSVSLYTAAAASVETWALYNGAIAYILLGAMFGIEYLIRRRVRRSLES